MRAPAPLLVAALSTAALLLTGCGGSDEQAASSSASAGSTTAAGSSAAASSGSTSDADVQAFCTDAETVFGQLGDSLDAASPADLPTTLDQAVAAFDTITPPAEISADWAAVQQTFIGLRDAVAGVDLNTPEGQATAQQAATDLAAQSKDAQTNLETWVTANCDNA